jgi:hypothetical protein
MMWNRFIWKHLDFITLINSLIRGESAWLRLYIPLWDILNHTILVAIRVFSMQCLLLRKLLSHRITHHSKINVFLWTGWSFELFIWRFCFFDSLCLVAPNLLFTFSISSLLWIAEPVLRKHLSLRYSHIWIVIFIHFLFYFLN